MYLQFHSLFVGLLIQKCEATGVPYGTHNFYIPFVSFSYDTFSADMSNLSLSWIWDRVGLFSNHGG